MPGRNQQGDYRYAYQGQEKDPETGWEAFELRMYDGRVGRWMTTDPYSEFHSPYLAMGNNPINTIDPDGGHTEDWYKNDFGSIIWKEGSAETITSGGEKYTNIGKTYEEVLQNTLFVYSEGKTDILAAHDLDEVVNVLTYYNSRITSTKLLFNLGQQPDFMKIHGTVVGFQVDAGYSSSFVLEGGAFAGVGFLANGKDYNQTFFGMYGYSIGSSTGSILKSGFGASGQVFWGVSHINQTPTLKTFAGGSKSFGLSRNGIIIQVGISEHWTTFSIGGGVGTGTSGSVGYGHTYIYEFN